VTATALEVLDLEKSFGATQALRGASMRLRRGGIHALVGENGAGKSTLTRIVAGDLRPDGGSVVIDGEPVAFRSPRGSRNAGIRVVTQERSLAPQLSVAENLLLGELPTRRGRVDWRAASARARAVLSRLELDLPVESAVGDLPASEQQLVEIAKALHGASRLLILDEPTAALSQRETQTLFRVVREAAATGISVLYISHRLSELAQLCDDVTVMRDGRTLATLPVGEADPATVVSLMLGEAMPEQRSAARRAFGEVVLAAEGLHAPGLFDAFDLTVRSREVVGLYGLVGSGALDMAYALAGRTPALGSLTRPAVTGFVPADRGTESLFAQGTVARNISAPWLSSLSGSGLVRSRAESAWAGRIIDELSIRPPAPGLVVSALSGGNAQKRSSGAGSATTCGRSCCASRRAASTWAPGSTSTSRSRRRRTPGWRSSSPRPTSTRCASSVTVSTSSVPERSCRCSGDRSSPRRGVLVAAAS
jgi:ABC-type sugar transport system ATPase subunit